MKRHVMFPHQNCTPSSHSSLIIAFKLKGKEIVCSYFTLYKTINLPKFTSLTIVHCIFSKLWPLSSYLKIHEMGGALNVMASKKRCRKIMFYCILHSKGKKQKTEPCAYF